MKEMLDIKLIRENPDLVKNNLAKRGDPDNLKKLDALIRCDKKWRLCLTELNRLRHTRRKTTSQIANIKRKGQEVNERILSEARRIDEEIAGLEKQVDDFAEKARHFLMRLPNLLHETVPQGGDETENAELRTWGKRPEFNFRPKGHIDLGLKLGIMDVERAAKIAGARFFYLKKEAVLLSMALTSFALREISSKGYTPIEPPFLMRRRPYEGVIAMSDFEDVLYKIADEDLYLIATSEHPIAAMYMNEVLKAEDLPLKFVATSMNFRKEAGAHGKDTRGIFRTHQFGKVEQFVFCQPEDSWKMHEELLQNAEELVQMLRLPYRVVNVCTGDIGKVASKKYDLEAWMPAQGAYREIISCSNCTDYQARRLNIRYREKEGQAPKGFVHTLNSTAIPIGRTIVAIIENNQQADGSIVTPKVLRKYMHGIEKISPKR